MAGVITASEPSWIAPFTGLSPRSFGKLLTSLRREGVDAPRPGRPWSLPLEDRVLLVAAYWRTNLTLRQLAPLFGVSKSAVDRIIDHLGPQLALKQRQRFRKDAVLIVDGTLVPTRDHSIAEQPRTTATPPTTRSSSMPTPNWSSPSASHCRATATTAGPGASPAPRLPSDEPRPSPTAATRAPACSSRTAAQPAKNYPPGRRTTTTPISRSAPASNTSSPA